MKYLTAITFIFLSFLLTNCNTEDTPVTNTEIFITPTFVTQLNPVDDNLFSPDISQYVIQGLAAFEGGWFVAQKFGTSVLLINYLDANGNSLYHKRLYLNSHGQDLSLEQVADDLVYLYTSKGSFGGTRNTGMYKIQVNLAPKINDQRDWSLTDISVADSFDFNYTNATPSISESKKNFAIRSNKTIHIHNKDSIENGNFTSDLHFELYNSQLKDRNNSSLWFQGIALKDQHIYCLTGNEEINGNKKLYVYDYSGIAIQKYTFDRSALNQDLFEKMEPEGLSFISNELYFTIMTKDDMTTGNVKLLYKITF